MEEGTTLLCSDNHHKVLVTKVLSNQSFIVESIDRQLSFTRLIENDGIGNIQFGSWAYLLYRR